MNEGDDLALPARCALKFRPQRLLGSGGFGAVYLCEQVKLARPVAVKVLHAAYMDREDLVRRFTDEARITASLTHPHIVVVIDYGVDEGIPWIAYEYVPGRSLRERLRTETLDWPTAFLLTGQVASALEAAHTRGIIHRDIKPDNIMQASPSRVLVLDFGLAKWTLDSTIKTATGKLIGTPAYLAPEVIQGGDPSPASDIYSLGITLYELIAGRPPHQDVRPDLVLVRHLRGDVPSLRARGIDIPPKAEAVIERALNREPAQRYPSARAMREALEEVAGGFTFSGAAFGQAALRPTPATTPGDEAPRPTEPGATPDGRKRSRTDRIRATSTTLPPGPWPGPGRRVGAITLACVLIGVLVLALRAPLRPGPGSTRASPSSTGPGASLVPPDTAATSWLPESERVRIVRALEIHRTSIIDGWGKMGTLRDAVALGAEVEDTRHTAGAILEGQRTAQADLVSLEHRLNGLGTPVAGLSAADAALVARVRGYVFASWTLVQAATFLTRPWFSELGDGSAESLDVMAVARRLDPKAYGSAGVPLMHRYMDAFATAAAAAGRHPGEVGPELSEDLDLLWRIGRMVGFLDWTTEARPAEERTQRQFRQSMEDLQGVQARLLGKVAGGLFAIGSRRAQADRPAPSIPEVLADLHALAPMFPRAMEPLQRLARTVDSDSGQSARPASPHPPSPRR